MDEESEALRQFVHILFGALLLLLAVFTSIAFVKAFLFAFALVLLLFIQLRLSGNSLFFLKWIFETFEKRKAEFPGRGALLYVIGCLFLLFFSSNTSFSLGIISILAFGDGFSSLIGLKGRHFIRKGSKKTWEGFSSFVLFGFIGSFFFLGFPNSLIYSFILAIIEAFNPIDDNLLIPLAGFGLGFIIWV